MTDTDTEGEQAIEPKRTAALPAPAVPHPTSASTAHVAHLRGLDRPFRASKGQRKHIRRQKQAGEVKTP